MYDTMCWIVGCDPPSPLVDRSTIPTTRSDPNLKVKMRIITSRYSYIRHDVLDSGVRSTFPPLVDRSTIPPGGSIHHPPLVDRSSTPYRIGPNSENENQTQI